MKKIVVVLVSLVVAILVIGENAFAHIPEPSLGPEWKLVFTGSGGTTYYVNTRKITYLPGGIVEVPTLHVPRGEFRRGLVHLLKKLFLSEGESPNNAETLWYEIDLEKVNCKTHQFFVLKNIFYSFGKAVLIQESTPLWWFDIMPGSPGEKIEKYVCNETSPSIPAQYKQNIPEPSLGPEWKFVGMYSNRTTFYFNTRNITYLPKGIVKVRQLMVPRGELRRRLVNDLKKILLLEEKDPNNAERLWYDKVLYKVNCRTHQSTLLEVTDYSFGKAVLVHHSFQHEGWEDTVPGSAEDIVEKYVCKKYKKKKRGLY